MGARERTIVVCGVLLALCVLASGSSRAFEPEHPGASGASSSVPSLPAFLNDERLPALEEAWRANDRPPQRVSETVPDAPALAGEVVSPARVRAEELSRRFSAPAAAPSEPARPSVIIPPAVPEAQPEGKTGEIPGLPVRKAAMPPAKTGAIPDVAAAGGDFSAEKLRLAAPPPLPEALPPLPRRAPDVRRAAADAPGTPAGRSRGATRTYSAAGRNPAEPPPDPMARLRGTILTNELRAFGWNTQPD